MQFSQTDATRSDVRVIGNQAEEYAALWLKLGKYPCCRHPMA